MTCFPLDVLRTRIMGPHGAMYARSGVAGTIATIVRQEGFGALYSGCVPALISVLPSGAVFYGTYDLLQVPGVPAVGLVHYMSCLHVFIR